MKMLSEEAFHINMFSVRKWCCLHS